MFGGDNIWLMLLAFLFQIAMQIVPQVLQALMDMFAGA